MNSELSPNLVSIIDALHQQQVIAYPTEAVFGLGCDPDSEQAVNALLALKQRPWEKGLILIAADYAQLKPYIDDSALSEQQRDDVRQLAWAGNLGVACSPGDATFTDRAFQLAGGAR